MKKAKNKPEIVEAILTGKCKTCWNRDTTILCKKGLHQGRDITICRWFSGLKETDVKNS